MQKIIHAILKKEKIEYRTIKKQSSFNNSVYDVNNEYILRVEQKSNKKYFKSLFLLEIFNKNNIKIPKLICSGKLDKVNYYVYKKILGNRLYPEWHKLNLKERETIVKDICKELRKIAKINLVSKKYDLVKPKNWKKYLSEKIIKKLDYLKKEKLLNKTEYFSIKQFCNKHFNVLNNKKIYLIHNDIHWGNIIIKNKKFQGIIDFDDVNYYPLDYQLTTLKKMIYNPKLFASKKEEKFIKTKDYSQILNWFEKYYPEIFDFKDLDLRQRLYSIRYDIRLLKDWPKSKSLRKRLFENIQ